MGSKVCVDHMLFSEVNSESLQTHRDGVCSGYPRRDGRMRTFSCSALPVGLRTLLQRELPVFGFVQDELVLGCIVRRLVLDVVLL